MKHCEILLVLLVCVGVSLAANSAKFATISGQYGTVSDKSGNIYVTSTTNNIVYQIDPETLAPVAFAGTGTAGNKDGSAFTTAQFNQPKGIAINKVTNELYVCDYGNNAIRKISAGTVTTISTDVTGPLNIVLIQQGNNYRYGSNNKVNPLGIYVTQENGQIIYLTEGPDNDDCKGAISLGSLSSAAILQYGSTAKATADPSAKCKTNYPVDGVWYSFKGNGNMANISTCNTGTVSTANIFVFRDNSPHDDTCANLFCMLNGTNLSDYCSSTSYFTSTVSICTQSDTVYYVVVDASGYNEGQFELRITDVGLTPFCASCSCSGVECGANNCGGYCADDCSSGSCIEGQCVDDAPNSECTGAVVISGNATISGDTRESLSVNAFLQAGVCAEVYYAGLWYKYVGEGYSVTLNTCSTETNFQTYLHVYEASAQLACDKGLYCVDYSSYYYCGFHEISASFIEFCAQKGVTYYYYIEGPNYQRGNFELTHTVNTASGTCNV